MSGRQTGIRTAGLLGLIPSTSLRCGQKSDLSDKIIKLSKGNTNMKTEKSKDIPSEKILGEFLGPNERVEEIKKISQEIFDNNISKIEGNLYSLGVISLIKEYENRADMNIREKLVSIFQSGMNAQRLLTLQEKERLAP